MPETLSAIVFGEMCAQHVDWAELERRFPVELVFASEAQSLPDIARRRRVIAVLVAIDQFQSIRHLLPDVRWIVCHPMSAEPAAETLEAIGAFHAIAYPLRLDEVRHSLGFVWDAVTRKRSAKLTTINAA